MLNIKAYRSGSNARMRLICIFLLTFGSVASASVTSAVTSNGIAYPLMEMLINQKNHESEAMHFAHSS
jgi:hypothetical protein